MNVKHTCIECGHDKHDSEGEWLESLHQWICFNCITQDVNDSPPLEGEDVAHRQN